MTLRTQPRRISPRSRRRYQAIRNFFRRALGNEFQINSNIALNIANYENTTSRTDDVSISLCDDEQTPRRRRSPAGPDFRPGVSPQVSPEVRPEVPAGDDRYTKVLYNNNLNLMITDISDSQANCREREENFYRHRAKSNLNMKRNKARVPERHVDLTQSSYNFRNRSESACCRAAGGSGSPAAARAPRGAPRHPHHPHPGARHRKECANYQQMSIDGGTCGGQDRKALKREDKLDDNYILDLIKRQYEPTVIGEIQHSSLSQVSAPVCRDRSPRAEPQAKVAEECPCCPGRRRRAARGGIKVNEMRSVCDTQLYNKYSRPKTKTRRPNVMHDTSQYDLIPVKETSSPNTRRKFAEDVLRYNREVPPSPKSHRPQLNLRTQYGNYEEYMGKIRKHHTLHKRHGSETDVSSEMFTLNTAAHEKSKSAKTKHNSEIFMKPNGPLDVSHSIENDNDLNKMNDQTSNDKTLSEIKNILNNFLQEFKKDSSTLTSASNTVPPESPTMPSVAQNAPLNYTTPILNAIAPAPYFSMVPLCPVNCIHNAYQTHCRSCNSPKSDSHKTSSNTDEQDKTDNSELLKEIYKVISENRQKKAFSSAQSELGKKDAGVDADLRGCRSCDAVSLRRRSASRARRAASCSDTGVDRASLPDSVLTGSHSSYGEETPKGFSKFLHKVGIRKKKEPYVDKYAEHKRDRRARSPRERSRSRSPSRSRSRSPYGRDDGGRHPHHHRSSPHRARQSPRGERRGRPRGREWPRDDGYRPSAPPYASVYGLSGEAQPAVVLREVEMRTVSTQFEPRRFSFFGRLMQKMKEARGPPAPAESETDTRDSRGRRRHQPRAFLDPNLYMMPKEIIEDDKVRNLVVKKFLRPKYPFSTKNILCDAFFGKETTACGKQRPLPQVKTKIFL